jgi:nucleoid DNA-binding protein
MNTRGIVNIIAEKTGQTKAQTEATVKATLETIKGVVASGEPVRIPDFGILEVRYTSAYRDESNPQAGNPISFVAEIRFSPAKAFKQKVDAAL